MYIKIQNEIKTLNDNLEENNKTLTKLFQIEENFKIKDSKVNELKIKFDELKTQNDEIEKITEEINNVKDILKKIQKREKLTKEFDLRNQSFRAIEDKYRLEEDKFYKGQAGILAENLKEGEKCPVCREYSSS